MKLQDVFSSTQMDTVVDVVSGFTYKAHHSLADTLGSAKKREAERAEHKSLADKNCVTGYSFSGDMLVLFLANGRYLSIFPSGEKMDFCVSSEIPEINSIEWDPDPMFRYCSETQIRWNWKIHLDELVGKTIRLSLSEQLLFLLIQGQADYYCIDYVRDKSSPSKQYMLIDYA